jgi:hypothetical protein
MAKPLWKPLRIIERGRLSQARLAAHHAVQWLARAARAYIEPTADDSHTNLGWDQALGALTTHPLSDGSRLALRIADLMLLQLGTPTSELSLQDRSEADIRAWLGLHLSAKGFDPSALDKTLPYELPASTIATGSMTSSRHSASWPAGTATPAGLWRMSDKASWRTACGLRRCAAGRIISISTPSFISMHKTPAPWASGSRRATTITTSPIST